MIGVVVLAAGFGCVALGFIAGTIYGAFFLDFTWGDVE
jgi:hypothetical protein